MSIRWWNNRILWDSGNIAWHDDCCCCVTCEDILGELEVIYAVFWGLEDCDEEGTCVEEINGVFALVWEEHYANQWSYGMVGDPPFVIADCTSLGAHSTGTANCFLSGIPTCFGNDIANDYVSCSGLAGAIDGYAWLGWYDPT